jgi:CHASE2 domain-containing sensor protein
MNERPGKINHVRRLFVRISRSHWRRFIVSSVVGLMILGVMRLPAVDRSMLGQPDREMMETAFKMRADLGGGVADPALLIDIDDSSLAGSLPQAAQGNMPAAPSATTPRAIVADVLEYIRTAPANEAPKAVLLDMDVATPTPGDEAGVAKLRTVLDAWARTPTAPMLAMSRESFPDNVYGGQGNSLVLPATPYDDIVWPASNIEWGTPKVLGDQNGVMREVLPYECVRTAVGTRPLYSVALQAYNALQNGQIPPDAPVSNWLNNAKKNCEMAQPPPIIHGELINYHLSLGKGENSRVWPDLPPTWPGFKTCGQDTDHAIFRRLSAADVAAAGQAGAEASHAVLCGRLVLIGGTNYVASDFQQTPLNEMSGTVILANATRGLQLSNGGLRRVPWPIQISTLLLVSLMITGGFTVTRRIRDHYLGLKDKHRHSSIWVRLRLTPFNPVVLNWAFAFAAHWFGISLLIFAMGHGYWGYLSAPAFAAAATGAMQEFADDDD